MALWVTVRGDLPQWLDALHKLPPSRFRKQAKEASPLAAIVSEEKEEPESLAESHTSLSPRQLAR